MKAILSELSLIKKSIVTISYSFLLNSLSLTLIRVSKVSNLFLKISKSFLTVSTMVEFPPVGNTAITLSSLFPLGLRISSSVSINSEFGVKRTNNLMSSGFLVSPSLLVSPQLFFNNLQESSEYPLINLVGISVSYLMILMLALLPRKVLIFLVCT